MNCMLLITLVVSMIDGKNMEGTNNIGKVINVWVPTNKRIS